MWLVVPKQISLYLALVNSVLAIFGIQESSLGAKVGGTVMAVFICTTAVLAKDTGTSDKGNEQPKSQDVHGHAQKHHAPFIATYSVVRSDNPLKTARKVRGTLRVYCDGKGRELQVEAMQDGESSVLLRDSEKHIAYYIDKTQRRIMQAKYSKNEAEDLEHILKQYKGFAIGTKSIAGHKCTGYQYQPAISHFTVIWIADDISYFVRREYDDFPYGTREYNLTSWSNQLPNPSLFKLPGYPIEKLSPPILLK